MKNINHLTITNITKELKKPSINSPERFGFNLPGTGNKTKICIIDSGAPDHDAIINIGGHINFTTSDTFRDVLGHATLLSGLIAGNKPDSIQGVAPDSIMFFAKATNDKGVVAFNAVVASVLWGIVKEVDVIAIPLIIEEHHIGLQEAINKASETNICVIMSATKIKYDNVITVSPIKNGQLAHSTGLNNISVPSNGVSTYIEQQYAKVHGSGVATAIGSGACLLVIENMLNHKISTNNKSIFANVVTFLQKSDK